MLSAENRPKLDLKYWKQINSREVSHLMAAEVIHNLYGRYWPRVNSIRFRHTITNFISGNVTTYAPKREWKYLEEWLSKKFLVYDEIFVREIKNLIRADYKYIDELFLKIKSKDLKTIESSELAQLLIDIIEIPLGEIYKIHLVQIEYSLNNAIDIILKKYEPNKNYRAELISKLIYPGEITESQIEEIEFSKIVFKGRKSNLLSFDESVDIHKEIKSHYNKYSGLFCAYGETPQSIKYFESRYNKMLNSTEKLITKKLALANISKQLNSSKKLLNQINDSKLTNLAQLLAKLGVFRDRNKAKMGQSVFYRFAILDEVCRRTDTPIEEISYYLLSEALELIAHSKKQKAQEINARMQKGISITRDENVYTGPTYLKSIHISKDILLTGICASPGKISGKVRIISSKNDIKKISSSDIMVARGTDFDLLEIINLSAGIITEEGGILSHASVVSRELNKPCIIGVENATSRLKDNDEILLDASSGVIKIIIKETVE